MFLLLDTSGMTTWEWKNLTNKGILLVLILLEKLKFVLSLLK